MTIIKSYTNLEQSKKLAEILPLESADMHSEAIEIDGDMVFVVVFSLGNKNKSNYGSPIWSLAALLRVIPKHIKDYNVLRIDISDKDFTIWYDEIGYGVNNELPNITKESAVDACVQMIIELNKMNLI